MLDIHTVLPSKPVLQLVHLLTRRISNPKRSNHNLISNQQIYLSSLESNPTHIQHSLTSAVQSQFDTTCRLHNVETALNQSQSHTHYDQIPRLLPHHNHAFDSTKRKQSHTQTTASISHKFSFVESNNRVIGIVSFRHI
jgi:hypothetical protein